MSAAPGSVTVTSVTPSADDWEVESVTPAKGALTKAEFKSVLNKTFGPGKWVPTSAYRSPDQENKLRKQGAGTVPKGQISAHSEGDENDPGAFDFQVPGMSQKDAAAKLAKADTRFTKAFAERAQGGQGEHVHAEVALTGGDDPWEVKSVEPVKAGGLTTKGPTRTVTTPTGQRVYAGGSTGAEVKPAPTGFAGAVASVADESARYAHPYLADMRKTAKEDPYDLNPVNALRQLGDAASVATAPFAGAVMAGDKALLRKFGPQVPEGEADLARRRRIGDVTSALVPVGGGEAAAEREGANALKAVSRGADKTVDAAKRLSADGVFIMPGMAKGGEARAAELAKQQNAHVAQAHRAAEAKALDTWERGAINKPLAQIGGKSPETIPIGRDAVANMDKQIGAAYDKVLPHAILKSDEPFNAAMAEAEQGLKTLPEERQKQVKAIVQQYLAPLDRTGVTDGATFKRMESQITQKARAFRLSKDADQRDMAQVLDSVNSALRESVERNSPEGVRDQIRNVNRAYAMAERVGDASARRVDALGRFTPKDLAMAAKKGAAPRQFRHGQGLMQKYAEDGIKLKIGAPKEGRPTRAPFGLGTAAGAGIGAGIGAHIGHPIMGAEAGAAAGAMLDRATTHSITNALATRSLARHAAQVASRNPRNYLRAVDRRVSPLVNHRAIGQGVGTVNALRSASLGSQQ